MALRFGSLWREAFGTSKPDREAVRRVKAWASARLAAGPDTTLTVNEIACTDPSCPGVETVILVLMPGRKARACKIAKPLDQVTAQDVEYALAP